jgi:predicted RNA-binding protein with RPS1 domain
MKQVEQNPWEVVKQNYPTATRVVGRVRNLTSYGAFIEIEEGIDGLLHINDMSWTRKVNHPSEVLKKGDTVETIVLEVSPEKRRVALGLKQLQPDPWQDDIPKRYRAGDLVRGVVSKLASFGAFVELEDGLEGLLHVSEMSDKKISSPEEIVAENDLVDVRVLRVDPDERKIGLSLRTEPGMEGAEGSPRIVLRKEQLQAAENPQELIRKALEEAPQRRAGTAQTAAPMPAERGSSLDIPHALVSEQPTEKVETAESATAPEEPSSGAAQVPAPTEGGQATPEKVETAESATAPEEPSSGAAQVPAPTEGGQATPEPGTQSG